MLVMKMICTVHIFSCENCNNREDRAVLKEKIGTGFGRKGDEMRKTLEFKCTFSSENHE